VGRTVHEKEEPLTEAFAQVGLLVDEDLGRHHVPERHEHLEDVLVPELLGQVVDEQVGALWACGGGGAYRSKQTGCRRGRSPRRPPVFRNNF